MKLVIEMAPGSSVSRPLAPTTQHPLPKKAKL